jgi:O-antigen ligase
MATRAAPPRLPFYALMVFTGIVVLAPQEMFPVLAPFKLALVSALVALVAHAAERISRGAPLSIDEPEIRLAVLLFALAVLSVPTSYWPAGSVQTLTHLLARSLIVFLLLANIVTTPLRLRALAWLLTLGCTVPAAVVVRDFLNGHLVDDRVQGYVSGIASNPNDVALTLNIVIPLAVGLARATPGGPPKLVLAVACVLGAAGIVVTLSRAGFLYLTTTGLFYLTRLRRGRHGVVLLLVLLVALAFTVDGFVDRLTSVTDIQHEGSARERWETLFHALSLVMNHPLLGVGVGQSIIALNETGGVRWRNIHNLYLEIAADLGLPALIVYCLLFVHAVRSVVRARRALRARGSPISHVAEGLEISLLGFAIAAMFYPIAYHLFVYYLLGLAVAVKVIARRQGAGTARAGTTPAATTRPTRARASVPSGAPR